MNKLRLLLLAGATAMGLVACPSPPSATVTAVDVSANPTTINVGQTSAITTTATGTGSFSRNVTFTVVSGPGTLSAVTATTATLTGTAAGVVVVRATSVGTPTRTDDVSVTVVAPAAVTGLTVSASPTAITVGGTSQITANVTGTGSFTPGVTFTIISGSGTLGAVTGTTATLTATGAGPIVVRATSVGTPTRTADVTVTVSAAPVTTGTVSGRITNAAGGAAIAGATVSIVGVAGTVVTDASGNYSVANVPLGARTVTVSAPGFQTSEAVTTVVAGTNTVDRALTAVAGTTGALIGTVTGPGGPLAGVTVTTSGGATTTTDAAGNYRLPNVGAGTTNVTFSLAGFQSQLLQVTVIAGTDTRLNATLNAGGNSDRVGSIEIVNPLNAGTAGPFGAVSVDNNTTGEREKPLPARQEVNINKLIPIYAAQFEDVVCITVRVNQPGGTTPAANAAVTVTGPSSQNLAFAAGCAPRNPTLPAAAVARPAAVGTQATSPVITTDANGLARFTIFAPAPDTVANAAFAADQVPIIRFTITANSVGGTTQTAVNEFKILYLNMSHLFFADGTTALANLRPTNQRLGRDFGTSGQAFVTPNTGGVNNFAFNTATYQRQPQRGPFPIIQPTGFVLPDLGPIIRTPESPFGVAPGFMRYDLTGVNAGSTSGVVFTSGCDAGSTATVCFDRDGSGVTFAPGTNVFLRPNAAAGQVGLPVRATVLATFVYVVTFGTTTYEFPLKNYTFTREFTGGFSNITKFVDNHVLTWAGQARTLPATNAAIASTDPFTSLVHVRITNPSTAPIFNLTVRDALPAELGVVTGSISDGGTYDATNHVVTWSFTRIPFLRSLAPGAGTGAVDDADPSRRVIEFSFRVYARQKPGFCLDPSGFGSQGFANYVVKPLFPNSTFTPTSDCYRDPYLVRNGRITSDVNVTFYNTDNLVTGQQSQSEYDPIGDESDINVVRPLYQITKFLNSPRTGTIPQGGAAFYQVAITQLDRVSTPDREYFRLASLYPYEFGANAPGVNRPELVDIFNPALPPSVGSRFPGSKLRDNPYGTNVQVLDQFDVGLDFTDTTPLAVTFNSIAPLYTDAATRTDTGAITFPTPNLGAGLGTAFPATQNFETNAQVPEEDKQFEFASIPLFPRRAVGIVERITLNGNLPSATTSAGGRPNTPFLNSSADGFWYNCAYLSATNLNQPAAITRSGTDAAAPSGEFAAAGSDYRTRDLPRLVALNRQENGDVGQGFDLSPVPGVGTLDNTEKRFATKDPPARLLEACARIVVLPIFSPLVSLTPLGEYITGSRVDPTPGTPFTPADLATGAGPSNDPRFSYDPVSLASPNFFYKFESQNSGSGPALGVTIQARVEDLRSQGIVQFRNTPDLRLYASNDNGATFFETTVPVFFDSPSVVRTAPFDLAPNQTVRLVVPAVAVGAGQTSNQIDQGIRAILNFTNPASIQGDLPKIVRDNTTVSEAGTPTLIGVSPATGGAGQTVSITGTNFLGTTAVFFGSNQATSFQVISNSLITAVVPAGVQGPASIQVNAPGGSVQTGATFTYAATTATVTSVTPTTGPAAGGTLVTITGTNLGSSAVTSVLFGSTPGTDVTVNPEGTSLTVRTPASTGTVPISVSNNGGNVGTGRTFTFTNP